MRVKATQRGEHPVGVWHDAGEEFDFNGKSLGSWMEPVKKPTKAKAAKDDAKEDKASAADVGTADGGDADTQEVK